MILCGSFNLAAELDHQMHFSQLKTLYAQTKLFHWRISAVDWHDLNGTVDQSLDYTPIEMVFRLKHNAAQLALSLPRLDLEVEWSGDSTGSFDLVLKSGTDPTLSTTELIALFLLFEPYVDQRRQTPWGDLQDALSKFAAKMRAEAESKRHLSKRRRLFCAKK